MISIVYVKAIKFIYLATANGNTFFHLSDRFISYIHNEQCDEFIVTTFDEIIYCLFATSFAYIVC